MIDSSVLFQTAVASDSRHFRARFLNNGQVLPGGVRSVVVHKGSCGGGEFAPGVVYSPYIEATIDDCADSVEGLELQLQIGVMTNADIDDPEIEYITIGFFTAGRPAANVYQTTFTAQGRISSKMAKPFVIPASPTLAAVAASITNSTGVTIAFDVEIDQTALIGGSLANLSCKDALVILASAAGGYATETASGTIRVCIFKDEYTLECASSVMKELPACANYDSHITGIKVIAREANPDLDVEEISYVSGDPVNLEIMDEHMTESAFTAYAANLIGLTYRPGTINLALGDPRIEPWDVIRAADINGNVYIVPCMEILHTFDGGVSTQVTAPGLPEEILMPSSIERAIKIAQSAMSLSAQAKDAADQAQADARRAQSAADAAQGSADAAAAAASAAQGSADDAARAAGRAWDKAASAENAADDAQHSADEAQASANAANRSAGDALTQLSVIEKVVDTVNWITEHGTYSHTTDSTVDPSKTYYILDNGVYTAVSEPKDSEIATYYELSLDEAVSHYVASHLALTNEGLWVTLDNNGYRVLVANDGIYLYDGQGHLITTFGSSITFSATVPQYIGGEDAFIAFYDSDDDGVPDTLNIGGSNIRIGLNRTLSEVLDAVDAAVTRVEIQYAVGSTSATAPASGWSTATPQWTEGSYIWQRTVTTANGQTSVSNVACIQGAKGDTGAAGATGATGAAGEDATVLRIDSSRGVLFKNNYFSTTLTVTVHKGPLVITNATALHAEYGAGAYLQWSWRKFEDEDWSVMLVSDSHITQDGFCLTITPADVDEKIVFKCDLITD